MACPQNESCPLFPHLKLTIDFWKTVYCEDEEKWQSCARVAADERGVVVPDTLLPDGTNIGTAPHNRAVDV